MAKEQRGGAGVPNRSQFDVDRTVIESTTMELSQDVHDAARTVAQAPSGVIVSTGVSLTAATPARAFFSAFGLRPRLLETAGADATGAGASVTTDVSGRATVTDIDFFTPFACAADFFPSAADFFAAIGAFLLPGFAFFADTAVLPLFVAFLDFAGFAAGLTALPTGVFSSGDWVSTSPASFVPAKD